MDILCTRSWKVRYLLGCSVSYSSLSWGCLSGAPAVAHELQGSRANPTPGCDQGSQIGNVTPRPLNTQTAFDRGLTARTMDDRSLRSKASQETFISLLNLDPAPMETPPPDTDKDLPPVPEEGPRETSGSRPKTDSAGPHGTSSLGLSGGGHNYIYFCSYTKPPPLPSAPASSPTKSNPLTRPSTVSRVQRYSSYTLTIFTVVHLATTSLIPLATRSVPASESYLLLAREIYQTRLSEPLLVGLPLAAHAASGLALRLLRRAQNLRRYGGATPGVHALHHARVGRAGGGGAARPAWSPWPPVSWISAAGYGLAVLVGAHAFLNRGLPLAVEGDSADIGLAYVAHGFARPGAAAKALAWGAYVGLLGLGAGHMVWGWAKWLGLSQRAGWNGDAATGIGAVDKSARKRRRRFWLGIHGVAATVALLWAAGGLGVVARGGSAPGWVGKVYDGLYDKVWL